MRAPASASLVLALLAATTPTNIFAAAAKANTAAEPKSETRSAADALSKSEQTWAFQNSDIRPEPEFRFGQLANGMRYIVRQNARPAGTALVRMDIAVGSLDERDNERGFAHFVEHMAFNGSTRVAEGEMVRLLERHGLAFGADTNASTNFDRTQYKLDLPRAEPELLDTALMLMRETASELSLSPDAVERERGVILSERRDRNTWQLRDTIANTEFFYPGSRFASRFPIGVAQTLDAATAQKLRAFYEREYVPSQATLIVVGDFDPDKVEQQIKAHFESWQPAKAEKQPSAGPIRSKDKNRTAIYIDPAVSERIALVSNGPWLDEPDSAAQRHENLLRQIGYSIVNRRLIRVTRQENPPFRGAGFGTGDVFKAGRSTRLIVDTVDGKWRRGLLAATQEYRRTIQWGVTAPEIAEQVAALRTSLENAAAAASTRTNAALTGAAMALVTDRIIPSSPADALARFQNMASQITPEAVMAAMRREAVAIENPLIRFRGRTAPEGGAKAIRSAWAEAFMAEIKPNTAAELTSFAYTDFGPAGSVASDKREAALGIRQVRFTNGVMLNIKRTDLEKDRIRVSMAIDGGDRLSTRAHPLVTEMVPFLDEGGLGKHSADDLQTILAGRSVNNGIGSSDDAFTAGVATTPRDLELQLQLWSALLTDPGFRVEGQIQYHNSINNAFKQLRATPTSALRAELGGILSDGDPRFTLQNIEAYRALTFDTLKADISERFAHGAIEIGVVGDVDEDQVIALVGKTLGALPARETEFLPFDQPPRIFSANRLPRVIRHSGQSDQALLRLSWPTRDDSDPIEALKLQLLERVVRVELTDTLREALGKTYSPSAASSLSKVWKGYGTFGISASIDVREITATRAAILKVMTELRKTPIDNDLLQRARQPLIEGIQNGLKSNGGWSSLVSRAQSEAERVERYSKANARLQALTAKDIQQTALRYLDPAAGLEVLVLPDGVNPPAP